MESRADMLTRHARELAELDSRWWEEWFTEDPVKSIDDCRTTFSHWAHYTLPTIIRKRGKIGVTIIKEMDETCVTTNGRREYYYSKAVDDLLEQLAGRTLAPGEKVEL